VLAAVRAAAAVGPREKVCAPQAVQSANALEPATEVLPAAQQGQTPPMRSAVAKAGTVENFPAAQFVQPEASAALCVPATQSVHADLP